MVCWVAVICKSFREDGGYYGYRAIGLEWLGPFVCLNWRTKSGGNPNMIQVHMSHFVERETMGS